MAASEINCPVCGQKGICVRELPAGFLRQELGKYFAEIPPSSLDIGSYRIRRCSECLLEYADPMIPGTPAYYEWIARHEGYYPDGRWDHDMVRSLISQGAQGSILDVGCGSGSFLAQIAECPGMRPVGLDLNARAVSDCRSKGLTAHCETLDAFGDRIREKGERFDHIVSFHCLEHVQNPVEFVRLMAFLLRSKGRIYLSTPYSPMSFEYNWFDAQNHPPHHLTRWNLTAFASLANQLGMSMEYVMPKAASVPSRLLCSLKLRYMGVAGNSSIATGLLLMARHPWNAAAELLCQVKREKVGSRIAANVVLIMLSAK